MQTFAEIAESITEHVPRVLEQFGTVTRQEPWIHLPQGYRANYLGDVISLSTTLALQSPHDEELCRQLLHRAADHGQTRLGQGLSDSVLFQELYLARESLWTYVMDQHGAEGGGLVSEAIIRIDMALSLAAKAALRGYHRPAFEERGTWPGVIDQLCGEWRPPPTLDDLVAEAHD